jgi:hypothetical protein
VCFPFFLSIHSRVPNRKPGRLFSLAFSIAPPSQPWEYSAHKAGSWLITLALLEHSPPTWIDSRLIIEEPSSQQQQQQQQQQPTTSLIDAPIPQPSRTKPKPTISLRLKSVNQELVAPRVEDGKHKRKWEKDQEMKKDRIVVGLEDSLMAGSLMYA